MTVLVVFMFSSLVAGCSRDREGKMADRAKKQKIRRGDLVVAVSASGAVEPNFQVEVKSKASGEILSFPFEPGDFVEKGQTMMRLDPADEKRNLAQKEADLARVLSELESARASQLEAKLDHRRTRKLYEKKLAPERDMDRAIATMSVAKARISEIEAAVTKAKLNMDDASERLADTVIASPIAGTLIEKLVERGQIISSGISSVTGGTKLAVIADLSRPIIFAMVDETDIGKVKKGQKVVVTVDAYPENLFEGIVMRIYPQGETSDNITVFRVKIEALGESRGLLRPKMTANVDMVLQRKDDVIIIPEEAVHEEGDGARYVWIMSNGEKVKRSLTTGIGNGFEIEALEGVKEGETVLIVPGGYDQGS